MKDAVLMPAEMLNWLVIHAQGIARCDQCPDELKNPYLDLALSLLRIAVLQIKMFPDGEPK